MQVEALRKAVAKHGSIRAAERALGISARTIQRRLQADVASEYEVSSVPAAINIDELLAERVKKFAALKKHTDAAFVRTVYLRTNQPVGVGFFGDPHLDDDGTNIAKVFEHASLFDGSRKGLYGASLGDVANNWVGRLERLYADQSTTSADALALTEHFLNSVKWLFAIHGNHDCVDYDTQALTKRGWMFFDDIRADDQVLGFNPETQAAEWQPILGMVTRENHDQMVHIKNQHVDAMVTPKHRVLNKNHKTPHWKYEAADELTTGYRDIRCAAVVEQPDAPFYDDELRLAGWLLTDAGRSAQGSWTIYQSKLEQVAEIRSLLERMNLSFRETSRQRDITQICGKTLLKPSLRAFEFGLHVSAREYCNTLVPDRGVLPDWVFTLSARQFDLLLDTIVSADGCWDGKDPTAKVCGVVHKSERFLGSLQAAAVSFGWRTTLAVARGKDFRLNISRRVESTITVSNSVSRAPATDRVWCLTVLLTNFMVRRNGKAHFTGNCWNGQVPLLDYMLASQTSITAKHEQRVRLVFPNGRELLIHARHKFPGSSQYMKQFGQVKAAYTGNADIYVGGDKHVAGYTQGWNNTTKKAWHAVQVASYKEIDDYPVELGLSPADLYQCPVAIIDPKSQTPINFIRWEFDPGEGAERLEWMRSRA